MEVQTLDQYRKAYQAEAKEKRKYHPRNEKGPNDMWTRLNKDLILQKLEEIADKAGGVIKNVTPEYEELNTFSGYMPIVTRIPSLDEFPIVVVGKMGVGKSSVINALLHRPTLASSSSSGRSVTQYMTKYMYKPGANDNSRISDITVKYLGQDIIEKLLDRLIHQLHHCIMSEGEPRDSKDEKQKTLEGQESRSPHDDDELAKSAKEILSIVFGVDQDPNADALLASLLSLENIANGSLLQTSIDMALLRIDEAGADEHGLRHSFNVPDRDVEEKHDEVAKLWPLVEYVTLSTGGILLKNGVSLIDVPGFGDANQTRAATAHDVRRQAKHQFIVVEPSRLQSDREALLLIRESVEYHGADNTTLVINKVDDVVNDVIIMKEINTLKTGPFPRIKIFLDELNVVYNNRADEDDDSASDEESEHRESIHFEADPIIESYKKYLKLCAQLAFLRKREQETNDVIYDEVSKSMHIFSVSADMYNGHFTKGVETPTWSPDMSGVPTLRRFALSLASQGNFDTYHSHCFRTVPGIVIDKLDRILQRYPDDDGYAYARQKLTDCIPLLDKEIQDQLDDYLKTKVAQIWPDTVERKNQLEIAGLEVTIWRRGLPWQTFDKVMRDYGIPINSKSKALKKWSPPNLNYQIGAKLRPGILRWKDEIKHGAIDFISQLSTLIDQAIQKNAACLEELGGNLDLRRCAINAWDKQTDRIQTDIRSFNTSIASSIKSIYKNATAETDLEGQIAKLNAPIWLRASEVLRGPGPLNRQQEVCEEGLTRPSVFGKTFIDRYEDAILFRAKEKLRSVFEEFKITIIGLFKEFITIMQDFLIKVADLNENDLIVRDELRALLPELMIEVGEIQKMFEAANDQDERQAQDTQGESSEGPAQKKSKYV